MTQVNQLPQEVLKAFFGSTNVSIGQLSGGIINGNFKVTSTTGESFVVQRISPIFDAEELVNDFMKMSEHLLANGWDAPKLIAGIDGEFVQYDRTNQPQPWRTMTFIASDKTVQIDFNNLEIMEEFGRLLARWHVTMRDLDYQPKHVLDHFHDFSHHTNKFKKFYNQISEPEVRDLSKQILEQLENLSEIPDYGEQLIHGDPRIANMLFRSGKPFTLIDLDTIMLGSIWIDLGDLLRSLAENSLDAGQPINVASLEAVAESYRQSAYPNVDSAQFKAWAITAMQRIAIELAMRFLNDYIEQSYFVLSQAKRLERAKLQSAIFKSTQSKKIIHD